MASTNKTANLKLSQYVNSDRPSYLQDYNEDMRKIDDFSKNALQKDSGWVIITVLVLYANYVMDIHKIKLA